MHRDKDEIFIICRDCNGYLYADTDPGGHRDILVTCPYKCRNYGNGYFEMDIPEGEQRYGRS